jgi:hypothetical protein
MTQSISRFIENDAGLVHLSRDASGNLLHGLAVDATYCAPFTGEIAPVPGTLLLSAGLTQRYTLNE